MEGGPHPDFYSLFIPEGQPSNIRTDRVHMASNECHLSTICLSSHSLSQSIGVLSVCLCALCCLDFFSSIIKADEVT